jgi:hypothetical protein
LTLDIDNELVANRPVRAPVAISPGAISFRGVQAIRQAEVSGTQRIGNSKMRYTVTGGPPVDRTTPIVVNVSSVLLRGDLETWYVPGPWQFVAVPGDTWLTAPDKRLILNQSQEVDGIAVVTHEIISSQDEVLVIYGVSGGPQQAGMGESFPHMVLDNGRIVDGVPVGANDGIGEMAAVFPAEVSGHRVNLRFGPYFLKAPGGTIRVSFDPVSSQRSGGPVEASVRGQYSDPSNFLQTEAVLVGANEFAIRLVASPLHHWPHQIGQMWWWLIILAVTTK